MSFTRCDCSSFCLRLLGLYFCLFLKMQYMAKIYYRGYTVLSSTESVTTRETAKRSVDVPHPNHNDVSKVLRSQRLHFHTACAGIIGRRNVGTLLWMIDLGVEYTHTYSATLRVIDRGTTDWLTDWLRASRLSGWVKLPPSTLCLTSALML